MAILLRRQLNDGEKDEILKRFGRKCFATGHLIAEDEALQFDHIRAFSANGPTELNNIAPMCEKHNKAKGMLPLEDFRVKLRLDEFFRSGDKLTLGNLLTHLKKSKDIPDFGQAVTIEQMQDNVIIERLDGTKTKHALYACPATGWKYFYATLPVDLLGSDDEEDDKVGLQPRFLIEDKVFGLFRHFQRHPVLQPSIGRVYKNRIVLFDGQHKIAALLWSGRRDFECKIYIDPELRLLNQTNIAAHDKFAQTRFYSSVMVLKLGKEFGADFDTYKNDEDGATKSEAGFMRYLERQTTQALTRGERNTRFRSYLYNSILEDPENRAAKYVSVANRSTDDQPLTIDMLSKSLFADFLYTEPLEDDMATEKYLREIEIANNVELMNMLHDLALCAWDVKAGPSDAGQTKLARLFRSKSIMAWSEILKGAICGKLDLDDADDRARPLYRNLADADLDRVKKVVERLVNWSQWNSPVNSEIDRVLSDNKSIVKDWLKQHGLSAGYLMGGAD